MANDLVIFTRQQPPSQWPTVFMSTLPSILSTVGMLAKTAVAVKELDSQDQELNRQARMQELKLATETQKTITTMQCRTLREVETIRAFGKLSQIKAKNAARLAWEGRYQETEKMNQEIEGVWDRFVELLKKIRSLFRKEARK